MVIQDKDIDPNSEIAKRRFEFQKELTPISQAAVCFGRYRPKVAFEITAVEAWSRTGNAASKVDVRISGVSALNAIFTPGQGVGNAPVAGVLGAVKFGTANDTIDIYETTDGASVMDDLLVVVHWRARVYRRSP